MYKHHSNTQSGHVSRCGQTSVSFPLSSTRLAPPWLLRLVKLVLFIRACKQDRMKVELNRLKKGGSSTSTFELIFFFIIVTEAHKYWS